jgi:predicted membrane metal-binding protein
VPLLALAYAAGTVAAAAFGGSPVASAAAVALVLVTARLRGHVPLLVCLAAVALAGAGHARFEEVAARPPPSVANTLGEARVIEGVVRHEGVVSGVLARLDLDVTLIDGQPAEGGVRLSLPIRDGLPREGDRIRVAGDLEAPPDLDGFDFAAYLRSIGVHAVVSYPDTVEVVERDTGRPAVRAIRAFRRAAVANIERSLPEPEAALAAGVLIGERGSLPSQLADDLRTTGTTHLIVVSGQNVAILLGVTVGGC